tara:strand:- start:77 stop:484 length:408 start_codon:yes stop_codon:yes gene_type:complete
MQKLFKILLVGLAFLALNVGTVAAQTGMLPMADDSSRPIGEGGEGGGPAAQDMSGNMINDGGHGANSGKASDCDYRCTQVAAEKKAAAEKSAAEAREKKEAERLWKASELEKCMLRNKQYQPTINSLTGCEKFLP